MGPASGGSVRRVSGTLTHWDDAKGYGFITPDAGGPRVFVHVSAFGLRAHRPRVGEHVSYVPGADRHGKPRAQQVRGLTSPAATTRPPAPADAGRVLWLVPGFAAVLLLAHLQLGLPRPVWGLYSALSAASFILYGLDKRAARRGDARLSERSLHVLALAGGWPGALLGQQVWRHKSIKPGFRRWFWVSVVLNVTGLAVGLALLSRS